jgi:hypothetical protein
VSEVTRETLEKLIGFLPDLANVDKCVLPPRGNSYEECWSPRMGELMDLIYQGNFVQPFDWPNWKESAEVRMEIDPELKDWPIEDMVRLLTAIIRQDRFCTNTITGFIRSGQMKIIIQRLAVIYQQWEKDGVKKMDINLE